MNKNLLLVGAVAVAGYLTLTAFGGKTKAEQMAEIKEKIQMGLNEIRTQEKEKCDTRVAEAVEAKYAEMAASMPAPAAAPAGKKAVKSTGKGPSAKPLPTPAPAPKDPIKTRGGEANPTGDVKARGGAPAPAGTTPDLKKRGGAPVGGGN